MPFYQGLVSRVPIILLLAKIKAKTAPGNVAMDDKINASHAKGLSLSQEEECRFLS